MLQISIAVPDERLDLIISHRFYCNEFPVEIDGRQYASQQLKFAGIHTGLNLASNLYEGLALFFEPTDGNKIGACTQSIDYNQLLVELLQINGRSVQYVAYNHSVYHYAERADFQQPATHGLCCNRVR